MIWPRTSSRIADAVLRLLGLIFFLLGALKLHGVLFPADTAREYLGLANPILYVLPNRVVLLAAALAELSVGKVVFSAKNSLSARSCLLLWLSGTTLTYKVLLVLVRYHGPCGCLFGVNRFLPLSPAMQRWIADTVVLATIFVSMAVFLYARRLRRADQRRLGPEVTRGLGA